MSVKEIILLVALAIVILGGIATIVIAIVRGDMKKLIVEKMEEAEKLFEDLPKEEKAMKKLQYVIEAVKEKYKLVELFLNIKKFVEYIISITKQNRKHLSPVQMTVYKVSYFKL